ncbi:trypsin-like peptidase domain-containing protein [Actinoplanes sp. NPDC026619]|uniref:S1C family serine protease n=1 Tax=Actinoplanes sp. NPDC026619 TaxID=3155798 RepID=UPI0033D58462
MTTTYDPFIPADGTDQHRYDGRRRAEEPAWSSDGWEREPRRYAEPTYQEPQFQQQQYSAPAWPDPVAQHQPGVPEQQRWVDEAPPPAPRSGARGRAKPLVAGAVGILLGVAGWQAYRIETMNHDNASLHSVIAAEQTRTDKLEKELAGVFDPEAVSSKVLPSVFRVRAGDFTGTAFSVGSKAQNGQSNLFTNYHVVAELYTGGGRSVTLERGSTKINAKIVKVNKGKDLALLSADQDIAGLTTAAAQVKPGQQVVVVGAPLGLDDTVTTGVISAYRPSDPDGPTIQFDAPINPGNSGGPVVNASNQVVGLATAKAKDAEGIGLAIPIKTACTTFTNIC